MPIDRVRAVDHAALPLDAAAAEGCVKVAELEKDVVRTALRVHRYYFRYTTPRRFTKGGDIHRMAHDHIWNKLEALKAERNAAIARLAKATRKR